MSFLKPNLSHRRVWLAGKNLCLVFVSSSIWKTHGQWKVSSFNSLQWYYASEYKVERNNFSNIDVSCEQTNKKTHAPQILPTLEVLHESYCALLDGWITHVINMWAVQIQNHPLLVLEPLGMSKAPTHSITETHELCVCSLFEYIGLFKTHHVMHVSENLIQQLWADFLKSGCNTFMTQFCSETLITETFQ